MKIVVAPDSFKGSLSSIEIIETIQPILHKHFSDIIVDVVPISDGGEGTIEATTYKKVHEKKNRNIRNPVSKIVKSSFGVVNNTAIIEMANCSGLTMIKKELHNPLLTTSLGTGDMIKHVLDLGIKNILIGIGGSATNDGGTGALESLGVKFLDKSGKLLVDMCGEKLILIDKIDMGDMDERLAETNIKVMCDVNNPLTGPFGATYVYGKQKGGSTKVLDQLEAGMIHYRNVLIKKFKIDVDTIPGTGAAGGMGGALLVFLKASLVSGIESILDLVNFNERIKDADLIITGEGCVDHQSVQGKVIKGVVECANKNGVPVIVIAGGIGDDVEAVYDMGVKCIFTLPNKPMSLDFAMDNAKMLLEQTTHDICALIKLSRFL